VIGSIVILLPVTFLTGGHVNLHDVPYRKYMGLTPNYKFLRAHWCAAFANISLPVRDSKLSPIALRGVFVVFVGYDLEGKGHLIYNPENGQVVSAINVNFDEWDFPFNTDLRAP